MILALCRFKRQFKGENFIKNLKTIKVNSKVLFNFKSISFQFNQPNQLT